MLTKPCPTCRIWDPHWEEYHNGSGYIEEKVDIHGKVITLKKTECPQCRGKGFVLIQMTQKLWRA